MSEINHIVAVYRNAGATQRLSLFLSNRELRNEFLAIELEDCRNAGKNNQKIKNRNNWLRSLKIQIRRTFHCLLI